MKISTITMESSIEIPQKTRDKLPYDAGILLLGIYPEECKIGCSRDNGTPIFIAALFTIAKFWKQPRCPMPYN
jgi:hypothetical protein